MHQSVKSHHELLIIQWFLTQAYTAGEESMYDMVHQMRTRMITSSAFSGEKILGAILFENTMDREIEGMPTGQYLWEKKGVIPFIKCDKVSTILCCVGVLQFVFAQVWANHLCELFLGTRLDQGSHR